MIEKWVNGKKQVKKTYINKAIGINWAGDTCE